MDLKIDTRDHTTRIVIFMKTNLKEISIQKSSGDLEVQQGSQNSISYDCLYAWWNPVLR